MASAWPGEPQDVGNLVGDALMDGHGERLCACWAFGTRVGVEACGGGDADRVERAPGRAVAAVVFDVVACGTKGEAVDPDEAAVVVEFGSAALRQERGGLNRLCRPCWE
jgi:hypothetical protein